MTLKKLFGAIISASPFVSIFIFASHMVGVKETTGIFLAALALVGVIYFGCHLLWGEDES